MHDFLVNISSFPTAIYTTSLVVVVGYWLLAFVGTVDIDAFDADVDIDGGVNELGGVAGLLSTLGLSGVPITVVVSLLMLNAWLVCYFLVLSVPAFLQFTSLLHIIIGIIVIVASFVVSILLTVIMIRPLLGLFRKVNQEPRSRSLLGLSCRVRSSRVDGDFGEVECHNEGASLIIKVRTMDGETFTAGDQVVLIEHKKVNDYYYVVSEQTFKHQLNKEG